MSGDNMITRQPMIKRYKTVNAARKAIALRLKQKEKKEEKPDTLKDYPLVSIIVPCYNQGMYLDECILSIKEQTYPNIEIVIVNDGSTDSNTYYNVEKYRNEKIKDHQIIIIHNSTNIGLPATRNVGIKNSSGKYIVPLDADDKLTETWVFDCVVEIEKKQHDIIRGGTIFFGAKTGKGGPVPYDYSKLKYCNQSQCTAMFYRDHWDQVGGYKEEMIFGYEDWEFWINMGKHGHYMGGINTAYLMYRKKPESMVTKASKYAELIIYQLRNFHPDLYTQKEREFPKGFKKSDYLQLFNKKKIETPDSKTIHTENLKREKELLDSGYKKEIYKDGCLYFKPITPKVSVIITCYNYGCYLDQCVDSVLAQTMQDYEIIIIDDNSADGTSKDIVLKQKEKDTRIITIMNQENIGPSNCRNVAISRCSGKYILPLDADDYIDKNLLLKFSNALDRNLGQFVYSNYTVFGDREGKVDVPEFSKDKLLKSNICVCCSMFRKTDWLRCGGYKNIGYEDWELWLTFAEMGMFGYRVPEYLFYYRVKNKSRFLEDKTKHESIVDEIKNIHKDLYKGIISKDFIRVKVLTISYNEEKILPFFLSHYEKFCDEIIILDNKSTDNTCAIAKSHPKVSLYQYDTGDKLDDKSYLAIKNNFWKKDLKYWDWIIVVDMDEFLYHPNILGFLRKYKDQGVSLPNIIGYNMIGDDFPDNYSVGLTDLIKTGILNTRYSKNCVFSPKLIKEINYSPGAHSCSPSGTVSKSKDNELKLLHYHYFGLSHFIERSKIYAERLRQVDYDWGQHEYKKHVSANLQYYEKYSKSKEREIVI